MFIYLYNFILLKHLIDTKVFNFAPSKPLGCWMPGNVLFINGSVVVVVVVVISLYLSEFMKMIILSSMERKPI